MIQPCSKVSAFLFCLLFISTFSNSCFAQVIVRGESPGTISLYRSSQIANSGDDEYEIYAVLKNQTKLKFAQVKNENTNLGFTNNQYWVRFSIKNSDTTDLEYYLETARPVTDRVNLYSVDSVGTITKRISGDHIPFSKRSFQHRKPLFQISVPAHQTVHFFLELKSDGEVINLPLLLRTPQNFFKITTLEQLVFGFFYGILFIASILYLFFFFALKQKSFLYYSVYVICIGLMQFSLDGYFYQYFTPEGGAFSDRAVVIFACLSTLALGNYGSEFLKIRNYSTIINFGFRIVYVSSGALLLLVLLIPGVLRYSYPAANVLGLLVLLLIVSSIITIWCRKAPVDNFFTAGIGFLILGFVIFILNNFSLLPNSFLTENSSKFGTGLEVIFLSLSMANLIRKVKNEREEFNRLALVQSEEMNDLKSYFLSNISHELRTPLNAIMNLSEKLLCDAEDATTKENCQVIRYSSQSLLSSVNDIIDFSKIEKGEIVLEKAEFDLTQILEAIHKNADYRSHEAALKFSYTISDKIPALLLGDPSRMSQVINNVLSNAFKFTAEGTVTLNVEVIYLKNGDAELIFTVSDTGIGIPKEKMSRIFNSFSQERIDNKRKFGGLGLGLYLSKIIVDMHQGSIHLDSKVGVGTTCTIKLTYPVVAKNKPAAVANVTPVFDLGGKHILVVEDNAINQMVIKMITKKWQNTTADYVGNGQESLDALLTQHYDIVLMDLQMPVMDGYEATIAIRAGKAGEGNSEIPIIAVTADVMETTKLRVKEIGMNDYLSKPITSEALYAAVRALV